MEPLTFLLAVLLLGAAWTYYRAVAGRVLYPTLPNVVFLYLFLYPVGMLAVVRETGIHDQEWVVMNLAGPICLVIGAFAANVATGFAPRREWTLRESQPIRMDFGGLAYWGGMGGVVVVSLGIMLLYTLTRGHIVITALLEVIAGGNVEDIAVELAYGRKRISAGVEGYQAPGYLKQFRDVLLPYSVILVYGRRRLTPRRVDRVILPLLFGATVVFMLGSGQRSPIFLFLFAFSLVIWTLSGREGRARVKRRFPVGPLLLMTVTFVVLTILLGRVDVGTGFLDAAGAGLVGLYERLVVTVPMENLLSKPVWEDFGPLYGRGWWDGLMQVLPGKQESIYNELHAYLGGSAEGNSALNLWAEVWINFGPWGIGIVGVAYGYLLQYVHIRYTRGRRRLRSLARYSFLTAITPLVASPVIFVIAGGVTILILHVILRVSDQLGRAPQVGYGGLPEHQRRLGTARVQA